MPKAQENQNENQEPQEQVIELGEQMQKDFVFVPSGTHRWRQRGPYIVCLSCEIQHAIYIGMERAMIGENADSTPILAKRK